MLTTLVDDEKVEQIPTSLNIQKLLDLVDKEIIQGDEDVRTTLCEMTAYSDALWLASLWPCPMKDHEEDECNPACGRGFLHDGKHWYRYQTTQGRWLQSDGLMHKIVAECCVLPYRSLRDHFSTLLDHYQTLVAEGYGLSTRIEEEAGTLGMAIKTTTMHVQALTRHIKRLHALTYQKEVLKMAAKLFFALPPFFKWKVLSSSILPFDRDGSVLSLVDDQITYRKALPEDGIIASYTPLIPFPSKEKTVSIRWFNAFSKTDLVRIQQWLRATLFGQEKKPSHLILWGISLVLSDDLLDFLHALLGPAYLSDASPFHRLCLHQVTPLSERELVSPSFKEKILVSLKQQSTLLLVNPFNHKIAAPFLSLSKNILLIAAKDSSFISPIDLFWNASPSALTVTPIVEKHVSHLNAFNWLVGL